MTNGTFTPETRLDTFSRAVVARISESTDQLPHEVTERLRAARTQALAKRKAAVRTFATAMSVQQGVAALQPDSDDNGLWHKIVAILPLLALLAGLVSIGWIQDELRADELATVDSELLIDELPPAAYVDPGFIQYLQKNQGHRP